MVHGLKIYVNWPAAVCQGRKGFNSPHPSRASVDHFFKKILFLINSSKTANQVQEAMKKDSGKLLG
jgi:DNA-binding cell septation regulator SpoVG